MALISEDFISEDRSKVILSIFMSMAVTASDEKDCHK